MNIFPTKEETDTEIIVKAPALGVMLGMLLMTISYFFKDQIGSISGVLAIAAYFLLGIHMYRSFTRTSVIRKAMKSGIHVHMSGSAYNLTNPLVYRVKKADL